jgi:hypothetical protein
MGAWSTTILGDDFAADVYGEFIEAYNGGKELNSIRRELEGKNQNELRDPDEGPIFWLALAKAQWDCGSLDADVLGKVGEIVNQELGLDRWREGTASDLEKRKKAVSKFYTKLQTPNLKLKKRKPSRHAPAIFEAGDCLVLSLPSGGYGAALVLAVDNSHKTEGMNLVGILRYRSLEKPSPEVFKLRKWLFITAGVWKNEKQIIWCLARTFRKNKTLIEKIASVKVGWLDPKKSDHYGGWNLLATLIEHHLDFKSGISH